MAKSVLRLQARYLRRKGIGIKTISYQLKVSTSTVSLWVRDIQLTEKQRELLSRNAHDPYYGRRQQYINTQHQILLNKIHMLYDEGIKDIGLLNQREVFIAGVALYWAEGFKKDNLAGFANSDPDMVLFFVHWLVRCCGIPSQELKFRLGVNEQYRDKIHVIQRYWQLLLDIGSNQFQKPFFQKVKWKKIYDNPDSYHGVLRIRVAKSTDLLRKINGWIGGIKTQIRTI